MAKVTVIAVVELVYETGDRSSRAWIEDEVVPPIAEDVKLIDGFVQERLRKAGRAELVSCKTTVAVPM